MSDSPAVSILFWLDDKCIMDYYSPSFIDLKKGDEVYIEQTLAANSPEDIQDIPLTRFIVKRVSYSFKRYYNLDRRALTIGGMDITLARLV